MPNCPPPLGTLLQDAGIALYLVCAELIAVLGASCELALGAHSRAGTLDEATRRGRESRVRIQLENEGRYILTARLLRFLGSAMLVVGVAFLFLDAPRLAAGTPIPGLPLETLVYVVLITFGLTFLINDIAIRRLVGKHPDAFVVRALPTLEVFRYVLAPLRVPLVWIAQITLRVPLEAAGPSTREEVLETVEEGEREGSLSKTEADMIESILVLETRPVRDIMTVRTDMVMFAADLPISEATRIVIDQGLSRVPVFGKDRDDVVGVFYARDLLARFHQATADETNGDEVRTLMRPSPFFVPETKVAATLLAEMRQKQVHMAIVVDEFNGTVGLVTIEDLLEEIVGDIRDEHDTEEPEEALHPSDEEIASGSMAFEGRTPIEDVNVALSVRLPIEDDFETISGLIFHQLGSVPKVGDRLTVNGVGLTVLAADARTVLRVQVELGGDTTAGAAPVTPG